MSKQKILGRLLIYSVIILTCCHLSDTPNFASKGTQRMIYDSLEIDRYFVFRKDRVYTRSLTMKAGLERVEQGTKKDLIFSETLDIKNSFHKESAQTAYKKK